MSFEKVGSCYRTIEEFDDIREVHVVSQDDVSVDFQQAQSQE